MSAPQRERTMLDLVFTVSRAMQAICLICVIGMTANFVNEMVLAEQHPVGELVGTLVVACIAMLYVLITYLLHHDDKIMYFIPAGGDAALLIALSVLSVKVGKPLSYLDCMALSSSDATGATGSFISSISANFKKNNYWIWAGANKTTCLEVKAVWGFSIAFAIVAALIGNQIRQNNAAANKAKDIEG
ncbi:hypothetical protein M7I_7374 [Glarea lozoyensis 74030]|uniref:MARVEL domain-containing protein n=1 Tax=Glarea lozoyensis (strain ATCC 74030 / MF5533) TaxID=1104152 RepID=H0EX49_GLAL7|nr:hypothetical protein M7I_7374 [Glarea lozoyensis 74030]